MNFPLDSAVMYALGFVGLSAFGLLPYRSWLLFVDLRGAATSRAGGRLLMAAAALLAVAALGVEIVIAARVFACLTETYCGPALASGWVYMALLGAVYIAVETLGFVLRRLKTPLRPH